jgi:hypothetical protein
MTQRISRTRRNRIIIVCSSIVVLAAIAGSVVWSNLQVNPTVKTVSADSFISCRSAPGSKLLETYPEQCVTSTGQTFTNPDQAVSSDLTSLKTYCLTGEKLCFEYPEESWSLEMVEQSNIEPGYTGDTLRLNSKDGLLSLSMDSGIGGLGGTCDEESSRPVYVLAATPITALSGFADEYNQDIPSVAKVVVTHLDGSISANIYVSTSIDYVSPQTLMTCGTGLSQYVYGRNAVQSAGSGPGAFKIGYIGYEGDQSRHYSSVDDAKAAYNTAAYIQAEAIMSSLRYQ